MNVVVLVPWRPGDATRETLWKATRPHLERLGWPIIEGDSDGPWSRGAAINRAAMLAGDWDVAVIADADTIPTGGSIRTAVTAASERRGAVRPHDVLFRLNPVQTRVAVRRGIAKVRISANQRTQLGGGLLVVERSAWDKVGGYDESYVGWGHEDSDINTRLLAFADWTRVPGPAFHLFHPEAAKKTPERKANWDRMLQVQRQHRRRIQEVSMARGYDVGAIL